MKKIYLLITLFVCQICVLGQVSLPILNNFESGSTDRLDPGLGWNFIPNDSLSLDVQYFAGIVQNKCYSPANSWFFASMFETGEHYLISPEINYTGADSIRVSFKYSLESAADGAYENFQVGYITSSSYSDPTEFTWRTGMIAATSESWADYSVNIPANAKFVSIHYVGATMWSGLYIDDIYIAADVESEGHVVSVSSNAGGTVSAGAEVADGGEYTLTATADEGHYIVSVTLDGTILPNSSHVTSFNYTLYNILGNHVIEVTFASEEFSIYVNSCEHGAISPDGGALHQIMVPWGGNASFSFVPDDGYHVSDVWYMPGDIHWGAVSSYTFTNVRRNYNLYASFALNDYTIAATAGAGGTITPSGNVNVQAYEDQSFTITPIVGYRIDTIWVDGIALENVTPQGWTYTFFNITTNHTISATFARQEFLVDFSCSDNGTVSVAGGTIVDDHTRRVFYSDTLIFNFQPNTGFYLADILLDSISVGNNSPYLLTHVAHNCTVYADFQEFTYSINVVKHGSGTVTPMSVSNVGYYTPSTFALTPNFCQQVDSIKLDGAAIEPTSPLTLAELSGNHQLDVYFGYTYYPIDIQQVEHGTIAGPSEVICDGNAQYVVKADPCYRMTAFLVDGVEQTTNIYTYADSVVALITHCSTGHIVSARFDEIPYVVNVTANGEGSISHLGSHTVECGDDMAFMVVPDECHYVASLYVDNVDVTEEVEHRSSNQLGFGDTLLFALNDITAGHQVAVTFEETTYAITAVISGQGRVEPATPVVSCGDSQTITITPDACNSVAAVWVDGADVTDQLQFNGTIATYTFNNVREPHTLSATFAAENFTLEMAEMEHGAIISNTDNVVACGSSFTFAVAPDRCYRVDTVWIDDVVVNSQLIAHPNTDHAYGDTLCYTFNNVTDNHTVRAICSPITYQVATNAIGHGQITGTILNGRVPCGTNLHYTITPDDCYTISSIIYNGEDFYDYIVDENGVVNLDFEDMQTYSMLTAIFTQKTYVIEAVEPENGFMLYDHASLNCGSSTQISFLPIDCYHLDSVYINGSWLQPEQLSYDDDLAYYDVVDIHSNPQISAHFSVDSVHFSVTEGAELSVMQQTLACGQSLSFFAVRNDCQQLDSLKVNGITMNETEFQSVGNLVWRNDTALFTFAEMVEDVTFAAFFSTTQYTLQTQVDGNGTVSYLGTTLLNCGDSIAIAIRPNDCYRLAQVNTATDIYPIDNDTLLVINNIRDNYYFSFQFIPLTYEVELSSNAYGSISGNTTNLTCGEPLLYKFIPTDCGQLDSVWMDGQCINSQLDTIHGNISYTIDSITSDHHITATFSPYQYEIEVRNLEYATINQPAISMVECDSSYSLHIDVDNCHELSDILVNGVSRMSTSVVSENGYNIDIQNVRANYLIELFYLEKTYTVRRIVLDEHGIIENEYTVVPCGIDTSLAALWGDDCYTVTSVKINNIQNAVAPFYTFNDLHQDITLVMSIQHDSYHISVQQVPHCEIAGTSSGNDYLCGDSAVYQFNVEDNYYIENLLIDGDTVPAASTYEFNNIHENHTISAIVVPQIFTLQTEAVGNGMITPTYAVLPYGTDTIVNIMADSCYHIDSVWINGEFVGNASSYLVPVRGNTIVAAHFVENEFEMMVHTTEGGHVSVPENQLVTCGESVSISITPDSCFQLASFRVNGVERVGQISPENNHYNVDFQNITEDLMIDVVFTHSRYMVTGVAGEGGMILSDILVHCGDDARMKIMPSECYYVESVVVNGIELPSFNPNGDVYLFQNVRGDSTIQATFAIREYTLHATAGLGGSISPAGDSTVFCGSSVTYYITPNSGYYINNLVIDGIEYTPQAVFTFHNIHDSHTIEAQFERYKYSITATAGDGGTVSPSGETIVLHSENQTITIIPDECYSIDSVFINGMYSGNSDYYELTNITSNQTVYATFVENEYPITISFGEGGDIVPSSSLSAVCGSSRTMTITPANCHYISSILVDGVALEEFDSTGTEYTFDSIMAAHSISAAFSANSYQVEVQGGANGAVEMEYDSWAVCGSSRVVNIQPNPCYLIETLEVNGNLVDIPNPNGCSYIFDNIRGDSTLVATFALLRDTITVTANAHGTVSSPGENILDCGSDFSLTITPDDCYRVRNVLIDGAYYYDLQSGEGDSKILSLSGVDTNHNIIVNFILKDYNVTAHTNIGGHISPMGAFPPCGYDMDFTIEPFNCYEIDSVFIDGILLPNSDLQFDGQNASFVLSNIREDHDVYVKFRGIQYQFDLQNNGNGIVEVWQEGTDCEGDITFSILSDPCERISAVYLNGENITSSLNYHTNINSLLPDTAFYTISNPTSDQFLVVNYEGLPSKNITLIFNDGENILATETWLEDCGTNGIVPLSYNCYHLDSLIVNNIEIDNPSTTYNYYNLLSDLYIEAYLSRDTFALSASTNVGGQITPNGDHTILCGENQTYDIVPNDGYYIDYLLVDGVQTAAQSHYEFANIVSNHTIEVHFAINQYNIVATAGENGSILPAGTTVANYGDTLAVNIIADDCYYVDSVFVNGNYLGNENMYNFEHIAENQTIYATFAQNEYVITATANEGGSITPNGNTTILCGNNQSYNIIPNEGYYIDYLIVDGMQISAQSVYSFNNVVEDHTVEAHFATYTYQVVATVEGLGAITPADTTIVNYGDTLTLNIVADDCYSIDSVFVNGIYYGAMSSYTFEHISANQNLSVAFAQNEYAITATAGEGGTVTPSGTTAILCGGSQSVTVRPDEGYSIVSIVVDGQPVAVTDTVITFSDITADHTVEATFSQLVYTVTATAGAGGSITPTNANVAHGGTLSLTITPDACYEIAEVTVNGTPIAISNTVTLTDVTADQSVNVTFNQLSYNIVATAGEGGTVTPSGTTTILCGGSQSVTVRPDEGYSIVSIVVDGQPLAVTDTVITFSNITADHTVEATFSQLVYTVTATAGAGGSITPTNANVAHGGTLSLTITPDACYEIAEVTVNGTPVAISNTVTLTDITADQSVNVTFNQLSYNIVATAGEGGTVTPSGITAILCGGSQSVTVRPDEGYSIVSIVVDGQSVAATDTVITFSNITADHTVEATFSQLVYTVTATAGAGGSITPTNANVAHGGTLSLTITPDACYEIAEVTVNGTPVAISDTVTLTDVTADQSVNVTFNQLSYNIVATAGEGGTVTPSGITAILCGGSQSVTVRPDEGYSIVSIVVDGQSVAATDTVITFSNITADHTVEATFSQLVYTVTATAGAGGSITPTNANVAHGGTLSLTITPDACYEIAEVTVNGTPVAISNTVTLTDVTADQSVNVTFNQLSYNIVATAGEGGTVTPSGTTTILCGGSQSVTVRPDEGYSIVSIVVDGQSVAVTDTVITFSNITADHTVEVTFSQLEYTVTATAGAGGSITPANANVAHGGTLSLTITPDACYEIAEVTVNGTPVAISNTVTLTDVTADQSVNVTFNQLSYNIVATAGEGGTVTPSGITAILCGGSQSVTVRPDEGYSIVSIVVDGQPVAATDTVITFSDITADHTVEATFSQLVYTVTATAGAGGSITPATANVAHGGTLSLTITPDACYEIAEVTVNGTPVAISGTVTLTDVTAEQSVNVTFNQLSYNIVATAGEGGTVTPSGTTTILCGGSQSVTVRPDEGYSIVSIVVDGQSVAVTDTVITFSNITADHTVEATFSQLVYTVTATAGAGGSITPTTANVAHGGTLSLTITPDACYEIAEVTVNGTPVAISNTVTLTDVTADQSVNVTFNQLSYNVIVNVILDDESVFVADINLPCGEDSLIDVPVFDCYTPLYLMVDDSIVEDVNSYLIQNIHENHNLTFVLQSQVFNIAVTTQGEGIVTPSDTVWVSCARDTTFNFTPATGWFVQDVILDGVSQGTPQNNSFTLSNVAENHILEVIFAINEYIITSTVDPINAGQISPYGSHIYQYGDTVTYTITPFPNYRIISVEVDGVDVGAVSTYTFEFVDDNHNIVAHFETTGIEDADNDVITISNYGQTIHVRNENAIEIEQIEVYDMQGRLVARRGRCAASVEIDLPVSSGTYVIRVKTATAILTRKLSISRW